MRCMRRKRRQFRSSGRGGSGCHLCEHAAITPCRSDRVHLAELPQVAHRSWQIKRKDFLDLPRSKYVPDMHYCHITPEPSFTALALYKDSRKNGTAFLMMIFRMTDPSFFFSYLHHKRVHTEMTTEVVCPQKQPTLWHSTKAPVCHRHFHQRFVFQENNLTGRWVHRPQRCASFLRERMSVWINHWTKHDHTLASYQVFREQYSIFCLLDLRTNKFCSVQH